MCCWIPHYWIFPSLSTRPWDLFFFLYSASCFNGLRRISCARKAVRPLLKWRHLGARIISSPRPAPPAVECLCCCPLSRPLMVVVSVPWHPMCSYYRPPCVMMSTTETDWIICRSGIEPSQRSTLSPAQVNSRFGHLGGYCSIQLDLKKLFQKGAVSNSAMT